LVRTGRLASAAKAQVRCMTLLRPAVATSHQPWYSPISFPHPVQTQVRGFAKDKGLIVRVLSSLTNKEEASLLELPESRTLPGSQSTLRSLMHK
jgi:hypothetical protein